MVHPTRAGQAAVFLALALLAASVALRDLIVGSVVLVLLLAVAAEAAWVSLATHRPETKFVLTGEEAGPGGHRVMLYPRDESVERVRLTKKVGGRAELEPRVNFLSVEPGAVNGAGRFALEFRFRTEYAGEYSGDEVGVTVTGPLGLFSARSSVPFALRYVVYPRVLQVAAATVRLLGRAELGETPIEMPGVGSEYYEMRAYQPGDDIRSVNWKATAREGELVVVEHMREVGSAFLIVLDARAPGFRETDRLASTFLSLANSLGGAGVNFGVLVHDGRRVIDVSPQQDPRASLAMALRAAVGVAKLEATPELLELVPVGITSRFAAGGGFGEGSVFSQLSDVRRAELRSVLESTDPWRTAAEYVRAPHPKSILYLTGLYRPGQPLIELAWEARHYRDADFSVANPCDVMEGEGHAQYQKLARALSAAGVRYHRGEPMDLARRILTA